MFLCVALRHKMSTFVGEYELSIDAKGRFLLPSTFRKQLPEGADAQFVITRGFEPCLNLYSMDEWNNLSEKINKLNDFNPKVRDLKRALLYGANIVETDSAGRLLVPKTLQDHAGLKKDIIFTSQGNKMEIWDQDSYRAHMQKVIPDFSATANEILGGGFISPFENL